MRPYFPGGPLNAFAPAPQLHVEVATPSGHRLQLGLPGYLILFAPLAFIPHRRTRSSQAPSPPVVRHGLKDFTPTHDVPLTSPGPKQGSFFSKPYKLACRFHQRPTMPATDALGPIKVTTTCGAVITVAAGNRLAHHLFPKRSRLEKRIRNANSLRLPPSRLHAL